MDPRLVPLTDIDQMKANGIPFTTTNAARWAFRNRRENGLLGSFVKIGSTIFIDVPKFHELVRRNVA